MKTVVLNEYGSKFVSGHEILNAGGPNPECWRPRNVNGRGQETCFTG
jgi:hypothetical protein